MNKKLIFLRHLKSEFGVEDMQEMSPLDRRIQIKKMLLIDENVLSHQRLSDEFFVSKSSIAADIEKIQSEMNEYTVKIIGDQKGTYILGTETQIQYTLHMFNEKLCQIKKIENKTEEIYKFKECLLKYYPINIVNISLRAVKKIEDIAMKPIAEHYLVKLFNTIVVLCYRVSKNKHHTEEMNRLIFEKVKNLKTYLLAKEIVNLIEEELSIHFTTDDTIYLNQYLIGIGIESSFTPTFITEEYNVLVQEIIQKMNYMLKVDLSNDKKLVEGLLSHIIPMVYRLQQGITVKNPLLHEIKEEYSVMLGVSWFVTSIIEETYDVHLTEDEVSFMMVHFQAALERNSRYKKVLIVCPNGIGTSELIANKVKRILPALFLIEVVPIDKLYRMNIESIDFIISAITLRITTKPVLYVSSLVTSTDIKNIMNYCAELLLIKEEKNACIHSLPSIHHLSKYVKEDSIFLQTKMKSQEEVFRFLIQELNKSKDIIVGFEESMYKREKVGTTALETGVAIPHGTPKFVVHTRIFVLTTEEMIDWGGTKVDTIILICISPKDINNVKNILSDIYQLIETRKNVEKYFLRNSKKEIIKLLKGGEAYDTKKSNLYK